MWSLWCTVFDLYSAIGNLLRCCDVLLQDDFPLASLPLLGYIVGLPSPSDGIHKDSVFKLQFKNHVYFFRAESDVTFSRYEVLFATLHFKAKFLDCVHD